MGVLHIDFARAFETINRSKLIQILNELGIEGVVLDWFISYLTNRKQRVKFNKLSDEIIVKHGVPQGSKIGPLLFIIYINTIVKEFKDIGVTCKLFADDMKLYFTSFFIKQIESKLNLAGTILSKWLKQNQMKTNQNKTVFSIIHDQRRTNIRNKCNIVIDGVKIKEVPKYNI